MKGPGARALFREGGSNALLCNSSPLYSALLLRVIFSVSALSRERQPSVKNGFIIASSSWLFVASFSDTDDLVIVMGNILTFSFNPNILIKWFQNCYPVNKWEIILYLENSLCVEFVVVVLALALP